MKPNLISRDGKQKGRKRTTRERDEKLHVSMSFVISDRFTQTHTLRRRRRIFLMSRRDAGEEQKYFLESFFINVQCFMNSEKRAGIFLRRVRSVGREEKKIRENLLFKVVKRWREAFMASAICDKCRFLKCQREDLYMLYAAFNMLFDNMLSHKFCSSLWLGVKHTKQLRWRSSKVIVIIVML